MINEEKQFQGDDDGLFEHYRIVTDAKQSLIRIDKFLFHRLANVTRNRIQNGIKNGFIKVNGSLVKASYRVHPADEIVVSLPTPLRKIALIPNNIPLNIAYEDDELLIVNKKPGMVVHPGYNNWEGTLANGLVYHFQQLPEMKHNEGRPGLVHRIDKDTSGLLVIAKSEMGMHGLAKQFLDHNIERIYFAIVWGEPCPEKGTIHVNLDRSLKDRRVVEAIPDSSRGKQAITHYEVLKTFRYISLIKCQLETGRTHQIRAHMKYVGHPLFNDAAYGGNKIVKGPPFTKFKQFVDNCFKIMPRQALHAKSLGFIHPKTKKYVHFDSELPHDFNDLLNKWEHYIQYN